MNNTSSTVPVVTVDGPGGTGKGTACLRLAQKLGWHYLDSGAVYRVFAWQVKERGIVADELQALLALARTLEIEMVCEADAYRVLYAGHDVTASIYSMEIAKIASTLSAHPEIRQALLSQQLAFRRMPGLVTDGRDMGTVVFPDATLKIYLDASPDVRAKRRFEQLRQQGDDVDLEHLLHEIEMRDHRDQERACAPLRPALDSVIIDSSQLSVDAVVRQILSELKKRCSVSLSF